MFRKFILVFLVVVLAACTGTSIPVLTPSAEQIDAEQQAVYAALLRGLYSASSYVIMDTTSTGPTGAADMAATVDRIVQDMRAVDPKTLDSFQVRNDAEYPVQPDMDLGSAYVLLSQDGMTQMFGQNQDGWQLFYEQHPDAPGITTLSRVGFNGMLDQALVYVGTMSHWLAGAGYFVLLKKVNGSWMIDQQVMTWIS